MSNSIRELVFDGSILSLQRNGGISRYLYELLFEINSLVGSRYRLVLNIYRGAEKNVYYERIMNIRQLQVKRFFDYKFLLACNFFPKNITSGEAFVYHSPYLSAPCSSRAGKRVFTVHDLNYNRGWSLRSSLRKSVQWSAIRNADTILCVSDFAKNQVLEEFPGINKPIHVTKLGVSRSLLDALPEVRDESLWHSYGLSVDRKVILYVGNRHGYKNFEVMFSREVMELLRVRNILVLCVGGEELSAAEEPFFREGISEVFFRRLPRCSDEKLRSLYYNADAVLITSTMEGFGLPLLEAFAVGAKVIAGDLVVFQEIGGNWPFYFEHAGAGASLCAAIDRCLQTPRYSLASDLISHAAQFNWRKTAELTLAAYGLKL